MTENFYCCPYCGSQISGSSTRKCPHCGEWLQSSHFGCAFSLLSIVFIVLLFSYSISTDAFILILCIFLFSLLYFLPSLVAEARGHNSQLAIFIANLFFGWLLGIPWLLCLIWACMGRSR